MKINNHSKRSRISLLALIVALGSLQVVAAKPALAAEPEWTGSVEVLLSIHGVAAGATTTTLDQTIFTRVELPFDATDTSEAVWLAAYQDHRKTTSDLPCAQHELIASGSAEGDSPPEFFVEYGSQLQPDGSSIPGYLISIVGEASIPYTGTETGCSQGEPYSREISGTVNTIIGTAFVPSPQDDKVVLAGSGPDIGSWPCPSVETDCTTVELTWSLTRHNSPPVAMDDAASTRIETPILIDVLANDFDPDGDPISLRSCNQPDSGTVEVVENSIEYTPAPAFSGMVEFECTIADSHGATDSSTVSVTISGERLQLNISIDYSAAWIDIYPTIKRGTDTVSIKGVTSAELEGSPETLALVQSVCMKLIWQTSVTPLNAATTAPVFWYDGARDLNATPDALWETPPDASVPYTSTLSTKPQALCSTGTSVSWNPDNRLLAQVFEGVAIVGVDFARLTHIVEVTVTLVDGRTFIERLSESEKAPKKAKVLGFDEYDEFDLLP